MAGPSLLPLNELQEQVDKFNRLAAKELDKGEACSESRVALLQKERELLLAQIDWQTSGEVQLHEPVLCCQAPLASG